MRVAVYLRISRDANDEREGVERQREDCLARAHREGWEVVETFEDNDISASGRTKKARPRYAAMLDAARAGRVDAILAYSNSRLTRRPLELEDLITLHEQHGTKVRTIVSGDDDLSTADGRLMARLKANIDAAEAERTSERRKRQSAAKRASGAHQGRRPFGWTGYDHKGRLTATELHPVEGRALKAALRLVLSGVSTSRICRWWNKRGLTTASGNPWDLTNLKLVLMRWRNAAVVDHQGVPVEGVEALWQPVCSREALETVRGLLTAPERRTRPGPHSTTLLSSIARCGRCGRPLLSGAQHKGRNNSEVIRTYRCAGARSHVPAAEGIEGRCALTIQNRTLDALVTEKVKSTLFFSDLSDLGPTKGDRVRLEVLSTERKTLEVEETEYSDALAARQISLAVALPRLSAIQQRRSEIETETENIRQSFLLSSLLGDPVVTVDEHGNHRASFDRAAEIAGEFNGLDIGRQREIIKALFDVEVMPGRTDERVRITRKSTV